MTGADDRGTASDRTTLARMRAALPGDGNTTRHAILGTIAGAISVLTLIPVVVLVWTSLWSGYPGQFAGHLTLENVLAVYLEGAYDVVGLFSNSLIVAVGMTLLSLCLGLVFAWLFVRTNLPTKGAMELVLLSPYAVPGYIFAIMYITTYGPEWGLVTGTLSTGFGVGAPLDIYSPLGMTIVLGVNAVTTFYLLLVPALHDMDPALEEVGRIHGANMLQTVRSISIPLLLPAILSGVLIMFLRGLGEFSVVEILGARDGFDVFATAIRDAIRLQAPPEYGQASALAISLLLVTVALVYYYRRMTARSEAFMTLTGRSYGVKRWDLGRWRWPLAALLWLFLAVVWLLPIAVMVIVSLHGTWLGTIDLGSLSLEHYVTAVATPRLREAFLNSVVVAVVGACLGTVLVVGVAYFTQRTSYRFRGLVEFLSLTPLAIPGIIMGSSVLFTFLWLGNLVPPLNLYGTLWIIVIGSVIVFIPFASRIAIGNVGSIHTDLEEAARVAGASWLEQMREIFLPLFGRTTAIVWFYLFIHIFQLISIPIMVYTSNTEVIPVRVFTLFTRSANIELVSAISTLFVAMTLGILLLFRAFGVTFYDMPDR